MEQKRIKMHKQAEKYFYRLDNNTKERIKEGIKGLLKNPPIGDIKELKGEFKGLNRLQIGGFRIIYLIDGNLIKITNIFPRGDVYKRI
jgi:mRNA interferase RelE/StbE